MSDLHPIVQSLQLSKQQLAAITGLDADALITAGAGTGKTRTLTARYLQLLARGMDLRSIVAITFTRKAAREMRNRIREQVWAYVGQSQLDESERERWQAIAVQMDAARISTIHGLCQEILRTHPAEAGVDPDFQTLDEGKAILMKDVSVEDALTWAAGQSHLAELLAGVDMRMVRAAVTALLNRGADARELLTELPDDAETLLLDWETTLTAAQTARMQQIMRDPDWVEARHMVELAAPKDPGDKLAIQIDIARQALVRLDAGDYAEGLSLMASVKRNGGRKAAWPGGTDEVRELKEALKTLKDAFSGESWLGMDLNSEDMRSARALVQLRDIALEATRAYQARKRDIQALDFDDLEDRAVSLLADHEEVRAWWQSQVGALLVDEFQDTNARQETLLNLLDGGRGIRFLVGDAKQSIYRFRGADVEVFQKLRGRFEAEGRRVAPLDETWRAHAGLVYGLNALLEPVLGTGENAWEAPFEPLQPARPQGPLCPGPPYIEFLLAAGTKGDGALKRAAQAAASRLQALLDTGQCQPGDVAILTRASTSFQAYEDALDAVGIPFLTLAGRGFYQRPEIRDLVVVMRAAADPNDDVALAGALRSPGLGLSDAALLQLARARSALWTDRDIQPQPPLWQALTAAIPDLDEMERERAQRAQSLLLELGRMAGRAPVADMLKHYLDETSYLAILIAAGQSRAARNVSKLVEEVQRAGFVQVGDFVEYVTLARSASVREGEAPVVAAGAVQIMSVHRAKGLEFPIVILGDASYQRNRSDDLLLVDGQMAWNLPSLPGIEEKPAFYEMLKRLEAQKEEAEQRRLLYVAATRAREVLLISGVAGGRHGQDWLRWLADAVWLDDACIGKKAVEATEVTGVLPGSDIAYKCTLIDEKWSSQTVSETTPTEHRFPDFNEDMLESLVATQEEVDEKLEAAEEKPERRVWRILPPAERRAWAPSWAVGTLVHRAIELERFPDDPRFQAWFEASARGLGLSDERMIANALARARSTLKRLRASELWQTIIQADRRIHEVPYVHQPGNDTIERGVIDIIWEQDGRWYLVDFKTDRLSDLAAMEEKIDKKYRKQVQRYIAAMQTVLGVTPEAWLCFLDVHQEIVAVKIPPAPDRPGD